MAFYILGTVECQKITPDSFNNVETICEHTFLEVSVEPTLIREQKKNTNIMSKLVKFVRYPGIFWIRWWVYTT